MFRSINRTADRGFTLIEVLVALAIIAAIAIIGMTAFDGAKSKAQQLVTLAGQVASGAQRFKTDTGVYPNRPNALLSTTPAIAAADTFGFQCGATGKAISTSWNGPYISTMTVAGGNFVVDTVSEGVTLDIACSVQGGRTLYYVSATGVPGDVVREALLECNNADADVAIPAGLAASKCGGNATGGTFALVFDSTR